MMPPKIQMFIPPILSTPAGKQKRKAMGSF